MVRMTFYLPDDLKKKLDSQPDINWPEVLKEGLRKKVQQLERLHARGDL
jgi:hypothetical protein